MPPAKDDLAAGSAQAIDKDHATISGLNSVRRLAPFALVVVICFAQPLYQLAKFALHNDLYSHVLLVPFVSLYLIHLKRLPPSDSSKPNRLIALVFLFLGALVLTLFWGAARAGTSFVEDDYLAARVLSFLLFLASVSAWMLGRDLARAGLSSGFPSFYGAISRDHADQFGNIPPIRFS